jgi:hypothetical protein
VSHAGLAGHLAQEFTRKLAGILRILYNPRRSQQATVAQLVEQTIRNRQVMGSNPIGGSTKSVVFLSTKGLFGEEKPLYF